MRWLLKFHKSHDLGFLCVFFFNLFIYLFIFLFFFWLCWVFIAVRGLSLVTASGGHSSSWCAGLSLSRPLLLRSTSSRRAGSVVVAHGPSCSAACGILPDQGSNPCPLHWQADSQPLRHQGSPWLGFVSIQGQINSRLPGKSGVHFVIVQNNSVLKDAEKITLSFLNITRVSSSRVWVYWVW